MEGEIIHCVLASVVMLLFNLSASSLSWEISLSVIGELYLELFVVNILTAETWDL